MKGYKLGVGSYGYYEYYFYQFMIHVRIIIVHYDNGGIYE